jgi:hypothetical protein
MMPDWPVYATRHSALHRLAQSVIRLPVLSPFLVLTADDFSHQEGQEQEQPPREIIPESFPKTRRLRDQNRFVSPVGKDGIVCFRGRSCFGRIRGRVRRRRNGSTYRSYSAHTRHRIARRRRFGRRVFTIGSATGSRIAESRCDRRRPRIIWETRIWVISDGDEAGERCAHSVFERIAPERSVRWLRLDEKKQPTDYPGGWYRTRLQR